MKPTITVFGEMLWDMLPSGKQPGGAPMNVAIHLKNFGLNPAFISRVGDGVLVRVYARHHVRLLGRAALRAVVALVRRQRHKRLNQQ